MLSKQMKILTFALLATLFGSVLYADDETSQEAERSEPIPAARSFVTTHSVRFNGTAIDYTVTAGETFTTAGGHMMYVNEPSRTQLLEDTRIFIQQQLAS